MINRDLKKYDGTKLFPWCAANVQATLNKIWSAQKNFSCKALVVTIKDFLPFFQDLISIFQTCFLGLEIEDFFRNSRLYQTLPITNIYDYSEVSLPNSDTTACTYSWSWRFIEGGGFFSSYSLWFFNFSGNLSSCKRGEISLFTQLCCPWNKVKNNSNYHSMQMFLLFHWPRAHHVTCK